MRKGDIYFMRKESVTDVTNVEEIQGNSSSNGVSSPKENLSAQEIDEMIEDAEDLERQAKNEKRKKNLYKVGLLVAIIIIIILLLKSCTTSKSLTDNTKMPEFETSGLIKRSTEVTNYTAPRIDIPVIQSFVVSKSQPYVDLYNPETNKGNYYLQFAFTVVGEEEPFYQSKLVEGGHKFSVNIGELLEVGEYQAHITTSSFEDGTFEQKSGDDHIITITVTE